MLNLTFLPEAWEDYVYWQSQDKKTLTRINKLIQEISRYGNEGVGKPEKLRGDKSGWWSRRIDETNRLVYRIEGSIIVIAQCRSHYGE